MKRDNVRTIRDEAEVYAYLNRIRDGRIPHSAAMVRRARIAGIIHDEPAGGDA